MDDPAMLRPVCLAFAFVALLAGGGAVLASLMFLTFNNAADVMAGASGLVAGAIFFGSGLTAMTSLATRPPRVGAKEPNSSRLD